MGTYQPELHGRQGFQILVRQMLEQIHLTTVDNDTFDFNDFDDISPEMQARMIKFAYLLHMRAQLALGTKRIHKSLDAKVIRMRLGEEMNRREQDGTK